MATLIICGGMIDGVHNNLEKQIGILCDEGKIVKIYRKHEWQKLDKIQVDRIDASDLIAIPGFIDSHVHLAGNINEQILFGEDDPAITLIQAIKNGKSALAGGVTTMRDCGSPGKSMIAMRKAVRDDLVMGPDVYVSGPPITAKGGHLPNISISVDTPDEARHAVHVLAEMGVDFIKAMVTGGGGTPGTNIFISHFKQPTLSALCDTAHEYGLKVAAHLHGTEGIRAAVYAGVDYLEHTSWLTPGKVEMDEDLLSRIIDSHSCVSITIGVLNRRPISKLRPELDTVWNDYRMKFMNIVKRMRERGVALAVGSDSGTQNTPLDVPYYMLEDLITGADYSIIDALRALTTDNARHLGYNDRGYLSEGKRADIVCINGNPIEDPDAFKRVVMTIVKGNIGYQAPKI